MNCKECAGECRPKTDFFNQSDPTGYERMRKSFRKQHGQEMPELKGTNCLVCGACYDKNGKRQDWNIGWLGKSSGVSVLEVENG